MNAKIIGVDCQVKNSIPLPGETILDDFSIDLEKAKKLFTSIQVYQRKKEDCPFGRGNWVIDINLKDGRIFCIKLPLEMTEAQIEFWVNPLIKIFNEVH